MKNIRKLILFISMVLLIGGFNVYAATVGDQLLQPETGWRRYDDSNSMIQYSGTFEKLESNNYYNNTQTSFAVANHNGKIKFRFKGTKLRIIHSRYTERSKNVIISIDGNIESYSGYGDILYSFIAYEKQGLTNDIHTVEIYELDNEIFGLDAIDIDEDGYLITQVGSKLTEPEAGWKRYDDNAPEFIYNNFDQLNYEDTVYNTTYSGISIDSLMVPEMKFRFYGSKLRFLGVLNTAEYRGDVKIIIDGVEYEFSQVGQSQNPLHSYDVSILQFEKMGLTKGVHTVKITRDASQTGKSMWVDAIDIDDDGNLLDYIGSPTSVVVTDSSSNITLNWDSVTDADSYTILRSTTSGVIDDVIAAEVIDTSYIDSDVTPGVTYYYVVRVVKSGIESVDSNTASAMVEENTNFANLQIKLSTTDIYEYRMTMSDVDKFMNWYIDRSNGTGLPFYSFADDEKIEPYTKIKEYLIFNEIVWFKVKEYL